MRQSRLGLRRSGWLTLAAACATAGCVEAPTPMYMTVAEVDSPAERDSGQPFLSSSGGAVLMSWLGRSDEGRRQVLFSSYRNGAWGEPLPIVEGERLLVNVADFPSVVEAPDGVLWAHWLERDPEGLGYGIRLTHSADGGLSWSEPRTPHEDGTRTEHGFVSMAPGAGSVGLFWLDGRGFADGAGGAPPRMETALYFRSLRADGGAGAELEVDSRVCDCCQTDVAMTTEGAVLVYRDRSEQEIRDIRAMRLEGGSWRDEGLVHADGWETGACPINGPAVAAWDRRVAVAWFTAADEEPRVQVAFSDDGGRNFRTPARVDEGAPAGRVDILLLADGSALVSWVERTGAGGAEVSLRRVAPSGRLLEAVSVTAGLSERAGGFPRLAAVDDDAIIVAWTDGSELTPRVRVTRIELEEP